MKIGRILKAVLVSVSGVIVLAAVGLLVWSKTGTLQAREVAGAALLPSDQVTVTQDRWIVFEPLQEAATGLIFYPGGLVEPTAYAPILRQIAEDGVLVVITPMPLNLAILHTGAASAVIDAYPQISTWIIAGHSLGGAAAAIYVEHNPSRVAAIALWDSYPADSADLSDNALRAISIYGTTDQQPNPELLPAKKHLLPADTVYLGIEGANHAQFGDYGPQKGDVAASISAAEQQDRVADLMLEFIAPWQ